MRGDADSLLAGGGIRHQENFLRLQQIAQAFEFLYQRLVDLLPAGGVVNLNVRPRLGGGPRRPFAADLDEVRLTGSGTEHRHADLVSQRCQLLDGSGTLEVARDEHRRAPLLLEQFGELGRTRRLAGTIEANHHDPGRLVEVERRRVTAEEGRQLVVEDFDDLLPGGHAAQHVLPERLVLDPRDERLGDLEVDVRLQQRQPHLAHGVVDVRLRDRAMPAQVLENVLEFVA